MLRCLYRGCKVLLSQTADVTDILLPEHHFMAVMVRRCIVLLQHRLGGSVTHWLRECETHTNKEAATRHHYTQCDRRNAVRINKEVFVLIIV